MEEHRGHPSYGEAAQARHVRNKLGVLLRRMCDTGFEHDEAVAFIAGTAHEIGKHQEGDTWSAPNKAVDTIENILVGRAGKFWSLGLIERAIRSITEELD